MSELIQQPPQTPCQFQPSDNHPAGSWWDQIQTHTIRCLDCKYTICVFCVNYYTSEHHTCLYCGSINLMQTNVNSGLIYPIVSLNN